MKKTASNQTQSAATFLDISPMHLDEEHAASKIIRPAEIKNKGSRSSTNDHDLDKSAMREIRPATKEDTSHTKKPSILPHTPQENASLLHNEE
jgi:hypothetical protein